jgi:hypothetical protein
MTFENPRHRRLLDLTALLEELLDDVCSGGRKKGQNRREKRREKNEQFAKTSVESWSMFGRISWKTMFFSSDVAWSSFVWIWREPSWSPENSTM